ncbi:MAG: hypothetical protein F6K28_35440 [Microcoleus sp. SIO2G3]|nr:hypothetical protein [Microcoleus sp. SIO2G3]
MICACAVEPGQTLVVAHTGVSAFNKAGDLGWAIAAANQAIDRLSRYSRTADSIAFCS